MVDMGLFGFDQIHFEQKHITEHTANITSLTSDSKVKLRNTEQSNSTPISIIKSVTLATKVKLGTQKNKIQLIKLHCTLSEYALL